MNDSSIPQLVTKQEAAQLLKISVSTIDRWRREGSISATKIGHQVRFVPTELQALVARGMKGVAK